MSVEVRSDNRAAVKSALDQRIAVALEEIGLTAEGYAKKACPVDTGRLRNSITHAVSSAESVVYVGTNVEYAAYVELGTSRQKAQPYLKPAANHKSTYQAILRNRLQG